jgi:hypothetical protein
MLAVEGLVVYTSSEEPCTVPHRLSTVAERLYDVIVEKPFYSVLFYFDFTSKFHDLGTITLFYTITAHFTRIMSIYSVCVLTVACCFHVIVLVLRIILVPVANARCV